METCRASEQFLILDFITKVTEFITHTRSCQTVLTATSSNLNKSIHENIKVL